MNNIQKTPVDIIRIMERTLNHVDQRLVDHGKRVAYLFFKVLDSLHKFDDAALRDMCLLGMLHDIGAYKTEEIDRMVEFETKNVWDHSIYGHLFLKYFSPLKKWSPVILFHHANCAELKYLQDPDLRVFAQLISLCDRADVWSQIHGSNDEFQKYVNEQRGKQFREDIVDDFNAAGINIENVYDGMDADAKFNRIFYNTPLTPDEIDKYIDMLVFSIDFRSNQTVLHTVSTNSVAKHLADKMGITDADALHKLHHGAMLHDLGKVGIPLSILESPNKLNEHEMETMRTHVAITEEILRGSVDDETFSIAVNHHEKMNGTGYPKRIGASSLAMSDRIVAVSDIVSALCGNRTYKTAFPREKVIAILEDMGGQNLLDADAVDTAITNYDDIMAAASRDFAPVSEAYIAMNGEYGLIRKDIGMWDHR